VLVGEELGDWFTERYGLLSTPLRLVLRGGRLAGVEGGSDALRADLAEYMSTAPCSSRVGEFAIGTNVGLSRIVGNFLQDEKYPGVHVAFGDPYAFETGADWECPTHVDVLTSSTTVTVDGRAIMEDGRFLV
jgi:leucyl aminopeptidase (aminopeptidase T)